MNFQDGMKQMFLRVAAGEVEAVLLPWAGKEDRKVLIAEYLEACIKTYSERGDL